MSLADQTWTALSACDGADLDAFFPEKGQSGAAAKAVCATCPVIRPCAIDSVTRSKAHYASADGIRAGMGGGLRRLMIRAAADCDHPPDHECHDPACSFCVLFRQHLVNLDVVTGRRPTEQRVRIVAFGTEATHGRQSTHARGCRCGPCTFARSTIGQEMSAAGIDVVDWFQNLFEPIPEHHGDAPHTTSEWSELDAARAALLAAIAKTAGRRYLDSCEAIAS